MASWEALEVGIAAFFSACLMAAAIGDLRHRQISNHLVLAFALGAGAYHLAFGVDEATALAALTGLAILGAGFLMFGQGWIGGGDVKLAAATALWLGPAATLRFLGYMAIAGAVLALLMLWRQRAAAGAGLPARPPTLPYGVAIATGGLIAFAELRLGIQ